ncbi:sigma-70 family RNA polymerase sigma factor [Lysinibacillus pakistanensis]|uniref:Sigma-70 family RNA polymerase sigma factor n=1 Tax=Lysinibacillus pakistanensis TaxID=759811 RepID=A0AAX3WR20_9BACI|nr:sigma-70 family RNA polymerase sigma factor [Lysinibacillus pakistanensis]MDM5233763.1 sigma-70 family RNA polymerase sigma factor [Lysinibacillus pakistanensis]WHY44385.1 sigma-70 family RNA polymerase sigma factor [Lysinibacillus pakistanensis]WHY49393.1 sigma-70 family RNA polymerase sigma factor [Lysinibacillus pakistanensis]
MNDFIQRLQRHDEKALKYVVEHYLGFVKAITLKILEKPSDYMLVEECVNDVFLLIWQKSNYFIGEEADFKRWIGMITKYKAIDLYRKQQKQLATLPMENIPPLIAPDNIEQQLDKLYAKEQLLLEIMHLPDLDRELFLMRYYLEYTNNEIAEILHISKSAVENRLYRGKKKLAKNPKLQECWT